MLHYIPLYIYLCNSESSTIKMSAESISNVKLLLQDNGFTLADFVLQVLADPGSNSEDRESLIQHVTSILCAALYSIERVHVPIFSWLWQMLELSQIKTGLHFNAVWVHIWEEGMEN